MDPELVVLLHRNLRNLRHVSTVALHDRDAVMATGARLARGELEHVPEARLLGKQIATDLVRIVPCFVGDLPP